MKDTEFNEAKQLYLEKFGDAIVTNNYLKIAVALLCIAALGLVVLIYGSGALSIDQFLSKAPRQ